MLKIIDKSTDSLIPYKKNNKKHDDKQISKLAKQIEQHGFDVPIVVDKLNVIIKGHGRLEAAKLLGLKSVPVIVRSDLSDSQVKAARIADNKLAESDWDLDNLVSELDELKILDFDVELTGFDSWDLPSLVEDDFNPDIQDKPESNPEKTDFKIIVTFNNADEMQMLFDDLNSQGYKVKVG